MQTIIRNETDWDRNVLSEDLLREAILSRRFPRNVCTDKDEFISRQRMLPFWQARKSLCKVITGRKLVLEAISRYPDDRFTSCDIAEFMGIPEHEHSVRAAIHWLRRQKVLSLADETRPKRYKSNTISLLNVYFCASQTGVDFDLLNKAFLRFGV